MAERRMFAKSVVLSDLFLDLPVSAQRLYFMLSMFADDDGFVISPKSVLRMCSASADDMDILINGEFIIHFESGVVAIRHWKVNNFIRSDRYHETVCRNEFNSLRVDVCNTYCKRNAEELEADFSVEKNSKAADDNLLVDQRYTQVRLGKGSLDKVSLGEDSARQIEGTNAETAFCAIPLKNNKKYFVYEAEIKAYEEAYPNVDVRQNLKRMIMWCNANVGRRKTESGIERFINSWLAREEDKLSVSPEKPQSDASYDLEEFQRMSLTMPLKYKKDDY